MCDECEWLDAWWPVTASEMRVRSTFKRCLAEMRAIHQSDEDCGEEDQLDDHAIEALFPVLPAQIARNRGALL